MTKKKVTPEEITKEQLSLAASVTIVKSLAELLCFAKASYYDGRFDQHFNIPDETYDVMERLMKNLCPNHPVLSMVGMGNPVGLTLSECSMLVKAHRARNSTPTTKVEVEEEFDLLG